MIADTKKVSTTTLTTLCNHFLKWWNQPIRITTSQIRTLLTFLSIKSGNTPQREYYVSHTMLSNFTTNSFIHLPHFIRNLKPSLSTESSRKYQSVPTWILTSYSPKASLYFLQQKQKFSIYFKFVTNSIRKRLSTLNRKVSNSLFLFKCKLSPPHHFLLKEERFKDSFWNQTWYYQILRILTR
jgi:hypothetical protein